MRDHGDESRLRVLVLSSLGAPERRRLRRRRRGAEPQPAPSPVPTTRVTVVRGQPADDEPGARAWIEDADAAVRDALAVANRAVALHRVATADPTVREASLEQALVVRVGWGAGEQVADGRWSEAIEVDPAARREKRTAALRPQERLAALLGGRDAQLACEELALRARLDLDAGRVREAALQLRVALEAALAELEAWRERREVAERLDRVRDERQSVSEAANAALRGGLDDGACDAVARGLAAVEAALRARTASGVG